MKKPLLAFLAVAVVLLATTIATADTITSSNPPVVVQNGTGFGAVLNVLSLQARPTEAGSVSWNGSTDVLTGDAKNSSQTILISTLLANGITDASKLGIVYNIAQANSQTLYLTGLTLFVYSPAGSVVYSASCDSTNPVCGTSAQAYSAQGTGSAGLLLTLNGTDINQYLTAANGTYRIGMSGSAGNISNDGQENFYINPLQGGTPTTVPEPASLVLLGSGLLGLAGLARRPRA